MVFSLIKLFDRKIVFWFVDLKNSWYYFYRQKQKSDKRLFLKSNIQIYFRQMVNRFMIFFSSVVIMSLISDSILSKCLFDIRIYEHVSFKWLIFSVFCCAGKQWLFTANPLNKCMLIFLAHLEHDLIACAYFVWFIHTNVYLLLRFYNIRP